MITHIEKAVKNREVTLGAFLEIKGAFDSTSLDILTKAPKQYGLGDTICLAVDCLQAGWQENYSHTCKRHSGGVCGQRLSTGGQSITLLGGLVVDKLIGGLNENDCYTLGYADDIILISRKFSNAITEFCRRIGVWYNSGGIGLSCLSIHRKW